MKFLFELPAKYGFLFIVVGYIALFIVKCPESFHIDELPFFMHLFLDLFGLMTLAFGVCAVSERYYPSYEESAHNSHE